MRNPGWAGATAGTALIAVALAVTACGTGSGSSAGGAYGYGTQTTQATQATQAAPTSPSSVSTAALKTETTRAGMVLANDHGLTLYYYSADKPHSGKSACTGTCATAWPPLAAPVKAPAGVRLPGRLGVITRPNGVKQVTLKGYPLYFYIGDKAPGQVKGNGIGGAWHVIKINA